jgi:hypothetical protein
MSTQKVSGDVTTMTFTYQDSPHQSIDVQVPNQRYNSLDLMFGVYGSLKENVFVSAMYTGKFGKYQNSSTAMVSVEYYIE